MIKKLLLNDFRQLKKLNPKTILFNSSILKSYKFFKISEI